MKTEELSGLELRKAFWEAKGWRLHFKVWHAPECQCMKEDAGCFCIKECAEDFELPPVESSIAVAMPELEEFCEKAKFWFYLVNIGEFGNQSYELRLYADALDRVPTARSEGSTPEEAIARCLILAMKGEAA